ncbi:MAG: serine/threonine-protein kinase, partial [Nannocystaceae bacterium]
MTRQPPFSGFIPSSLKLPRRDGVLGEANLQAPDFAGRTIAGRYRVVVALGQGAICTTYRARDLEADRDVALKVLDNHRFSGSDRERAQRRFIQDARAAMRLQHPNIAETYAAGIDGGLAHVACELLADGSDLAALTDQQGPLSWPRALPILMQICDALEAAHTMGTTHGALHPCYCYVTGDGADFVQVRDFGLTRVLDELSSGTDDGEADRMPVNPEYTAPELIRGGKPTQQTDIYACGVVMYKLLTG